MMGAASKLPTYEVVLAANGIHRLSSLSADTCQLCYTVHIMKNAGRRDVSTDRDRQMHNATHNAPTAAETLGLEEISVFVRSGTDSGSYSDPATISPNMRGERDFRVGIATTGDGLR